MLCCRLSAYPCCGVTSALAGHVLRSGQALHSLSKDFCACDAVPAQAASITAQQTGGAIQRSSTSAVPLDSLNNEPVMMPPSDGSSQEHDSDDEAIFADFEATHLAPAAPTHSSSNHVSGSSAGGSSSTKSSKTGSKLVAALRGRNHKQQQQVEQPAQHEGLQSRISAPSGHVNGAASAGGTGAGPYLRSRSVSFRSVSAPGHRESSDGAGANGVVPGVAVARIQGCWLSHLNIDNQRCVVQ